MTVSRKLLTGTGLLTAAGVGSRAIAIVTSPVLTRLLGPSQYGILALANSLISLASTVALLGVDMPYSRQVGGEAAHREAVERFCWRFAAAGAVIGGTVAAGAWTLLVPGTSAAVALVVGLLVALTVANTMAMTRRRLSGDYPRMAAITLAAALVTAAVSLSLVVAGMRQALSLLVGAAAGLAVSVVLLGTPAAASFGQSSGLRQAQRLELFRMSAAGAIGAPMYWVLMLSDRWFLDLYWSRETTGIYSFAASVATLGAVLNSAITLTWFPEAAKAFEADREASAAYLGGLWARLVTLQMLVWLLVCAAGGDAIRLLADARFHDGARYVPFIAGGIFFYGTATMANTGLWLAKDMAPAARWWAVGAMLSVLLNYLLVPAYGPLAASVAMCAAFAFITAAVLRASQKRTRIVIAWQSLSVSAVVVIVAGAALTAAWHANPLVSVILKVPVLLVITAAVLRVRPAAASAQLRAAFPWRPAVAMVPSFRSKVE